MTVSDCFASLGRDRADGSHLSSNHLILTAPVLCEFLSSYFTCIITHGYMPKSLKDCILVPIPKFLKDPSLSDNYRPIALAPSLSKITERCILLQFSSCFCTSVLQLGFKSGYSTDLCTGLLKNVVSSYIN